MKKRRAKEPGWDASFWFAISIPSTGVLLIFLVVAIFLDEAKTP